MPHDDTRTGPIMRAPGRCYDCGAHAGQRCRMNCALRSGAPIGEGWVPFGSTIGDDDYGATAGWPERTFGLPVDLGPDPTPRARCGLCGEPDDAVKGPVVEGYHALCAERFAFVASLTAMP